MRKRLFKIALLAFMIHSANSKASLYKSEIHSRYFEFNKDKGTPFFTAIKKDAPARSLSREQTGKILGEVKTRKKYVLIQKRAHLSFHTKRWVSYGEFQTIKKLLVLLLQTGRIRGAGAEKGFCERQRGAAQV